MVDLLGRPCCADCFDSCLKRSPRDSSQRRTGPSDEDLRSNLGGTKRVDRENEGSSALSELEQRLGIVRARDNTPVKEGARTMPVTPTTTYSPVATRYTPRNIGEPSPVVERLAERARSDSYTRMGSAPVSHSTGGSTYAERVAHNLKSTETDLDSVSPLPPRRTFSYRSPGLGDGPSDGGLVRRRTHNRGKSMDPDIFSNPIPRVGSPRFSSPSSSKQPSEEAIEAMKNRFLRMASPGPSSGPNLTNTGSALQPATPKSRWRSRPRYSQASLTGDAATGSVDLSGTIRLSDLRRSSYHSSQSSVLRDRTGDTEPILARDRTGDTDEPLGRDRTGDMRYHLRRDRTGDSEVQQRSNMRRSATGDVNLTLRRDRTGDAEVASLLDNGMIGTFNNGEASGPMTAIPDAGDTPSARRDSVASSSLGRAYEQSVPSTPDLAGDFSDTASTAPSSTPPTPHSVSPSARQSLDYADGLRKRGITGQAADYHNSRSRHPNDNPTSSHTPKSQSLPGGFPVSSPLPLSPDARCAKCDLPLFSTKHGGKFVTVPEEPSTNGAPPKTYHITCFRCKICDRPFEEREGGRAVFVRGEEGACHIECAPPEKIKVRHVPSMLPLPKPVPAPLPTPKSSNTIVTPLYSSPSISSRYERPPTTAPATTSTFTFPRFGGSTSCPGCSKAVSPMERGVVPGPQGTRWHATCLLCGGKEAKGRRKETGKPGCGKQLDSAAKTDIDGRVWCRECLLLLPLDMRNVQANMLGPLAPTPTDGRGVAAHSTGTTTLARQFTGMGGGSGNDSAVVRQLTGGGLSPTRQLRSSSPTKLYDGPRPGRTFPRPKSVSGTRSKSDGEGRGMFLVRQLTGGNSGSSANTYGL
ncbi:hypothetical protein WOLCODRAFT_135176 [Wolfiporia cocos MD-104 SS10]|uniref:LIM zinc-binding domain-containing protein n=1 Tax=Wolfiporia cocos (strain MD-104) TaxID=742152 RepID=A0A2H3J460_WOLCO|nr:hypothetical protein WOLCODRAFT_135176 [Wolfiporia cocos MD-104 SS10]